MGLFDSLFGSDPETTIVPQSRLSGEQKQILRKQLLPYFTQEGPLSEFEGAPFPGEFTAPLSGLEQLSLEGLEERARGLISGETTTPTQAASTALTDILQGGGGRDFEEFFRETIREPALEQFEEDIIPGISRRFAQDFFGGERIQAEESAREDLIDALTRARAGLAFEERGSSLDRMLQAAGLAPGITSAETGELTTLLGAGGVPRAVEQAELGAEYQDFLRRREEQSRRVNQMLSSLGIPMQENIVLQSGGSEGLLSAFAPAVGSFLGSPAGSKGLASILSSSRTLKENNTPLDGEDMLMKFKELPIEFWNYIGDSTKHIGPYAEDFKDTYGVGDGKTIAVVDVLGVLAATTQAAIEKLEQLQRQEA